MFKRWWRRILSSFLAGLFTILPLVITLAIIGWVAGFISGLIGRKTFIGRQIEWMGGSLVGDHQVLAYLIGCVLVLGAIFALGVIVQMGFRKLLNSLVAPIIKRIPIAGSLYGATSKVVGLLEKRDDSEMTGMSVVFCTFGRENPTGLLALLPTRDRYPINGREYQLVYIPTSPLPMTGGLLFVPVESVQPVDMSVESLMSIYLSMGVTGPDLLGKEQVQAVEDKN